MGDIDQKFIQVRGKVATNEELTHGQDIEVTVTVTEITDKDNFDGTVDRTYKCALFAPEGGWATKAEVHKEAKTPSQRMREALFVYFTTVLGGKPEDFDAYYEKVMEKKIEEIKEKLS